MGEGIWCFFQKFCYGVHNVKNPCFKQVFEKKNMFYAHMCWNLVSIDQTVKIKQQKNNFDQIKENIFFRRKYFLKKQWPVNRKAQTEFRILHSDIQIKTFNNSFLIWNKTDNLYIGNYLWNTWKHTCIHVNDSWFSNYIL